MKTQNTYLPNLTSLFMKHEAYQRHLKKIKEARSQYCITNQQKKLPIKKTSLQAIKTKELLILNKRKNNNSESYEAFYLPSKLPPHQKKIRSQIKFGNNRLFKSLMQVKPIIMSRKSTANSKIQDDHLQRICRYTKNKDKIYYKYGVSLTKIMEKKLKNTSKGSKTKSFSHIEKQILPQNNNIQNSLKKQKINDFTCSHLFCGFDANDSSDIQQSPQQQLKSNTQKISMTNQFAKYNKGYSVNLKKFRANLHSKRISPIQKGKECNESSQLYSFVAI